MNKLLSFLLAIIFCTVFLCACDTQRTNETQASSDTIASTAVTEESSTVSADAYKGDNPSAPDAETVVKVFMENIEEWNKVPDFSNWNGYLFLDLNFDGTLELIVTSNSGSGQFSENTYYTYNTADGSIAELVFSDKQADLQSDFFFTDYPKLYKDNETGDMRYIFRDHIRPTGWEHSDVFEEISADKAEITASKLWAVYCTGSESSDGTSSEYSYYIYNESGDSTEVDKEAYDSAIAEYEKSHTQLPLHFEVVHGIDFSEADTDTQQELLLSSYKAFYY